MVCLTLGAGVVRPGCDCFLFPRRRWRCFFLARRRVPFISNPYHAGFVQDIRARRPYRPYFWLPGVLRGADSLVPFRAPVAA